MLNAGEPRLLRRRQFPSKDYPGLDKGRMADFLSRIPVSVVVNPDVGLLGAAAFAMRHWPGA
jgi:glucokinase